MFPSFNVYERAVHVHVGSEQTGWYTSPFALPGAMDGRGHRLALQNWAAARNVPLTVNRVAMVMVMVILPYGQSTTSEYGAIEIGTVPEGSYQS